MTNHDRLLKYGYGIIRLSILFLFISFHYVSPRIVLFQSSYFPIFPFSFISSSSTTSHSLRLGLWLSRYHGCIYLGSIGAPINIKIYNFSLNLLLLVIGGVYCLYDSYIYRDYIILIYLLKTFTGDYLAGKLDTVEWKLVLFFIYGLVLPLHLYSDSQFPQNFHSYLPIFLYLFIIQFICEYGDNYYESWTFFRHRYSYEILNLLLVLLVPLTEYELSIVQYDMLICLWYRISNALYILYQTDIISIYLKILGFKLHGYIIGIPVVNVTDPEIAMLVMKNSNDKGLALER